MKTIYFNITILFSGLFLLQPIGIEKLYSQDPELTEHTWHLTKVTVDGTDYIPADFGFFPNVQFSEFEGIYEIAFGDPFNISCSSEIDDFQIDPNRFTIIVPGSLCLPDQTCLDAPNPEDPCTIIYGNHADIYYTTNAPLIYFIEQISNKTYTLEIINAEGNQAFYSSEFLPIEDFLFQNLSIYPNPTINNLYINKTFRQSVEATIYNLSGKQLKTQTLETSSSTIDVKALKKGLYFLVFKSESGHRVSKKFIKN